MSNATGVVYFVACGSLTKIGFTKDIKTRLGRLQIGNPRKLRLVGVIPGDRIAEQNLHYRFGRYRVRGEWFRLPAEEIEALLSSPEFDRQDEGER